jgi:hypothetical protein
MTGQWRGGDSPEARAAYRAFVRAHHPDRGGDVDTFVAGLAGFRSAEPVPHEPDRYDAPVVVVVHPRGVRALTQRLRRWWRRLRTPHATRVR